MKRIRRILLRSQDEFHAPGIFKGAGLEIMESPDDAEAAVVVGGDGTILRAMDELLGTGLPILGVNAGHIGFLADCELSSVNESIQCLLSGDYMIDLLSVLETTGPEGTNVRALNEICINRRTDSGILHIKVLVDRREIADLASDGILVSTPSGSTAYNLSCGGPVLHPNLPALIITPICPHLLAIRPIVVPVSSLIEFTVTRARGRDPLILADGAAKCGSISPGQTISIRISDQKCPVIRTGRRSDYYEMLGRKLGWGYRGWTFADA